MKVAINSCHGGFDLSKEAQELYCAWMGIDPGAWNENWNYFSDFHVRDLKRDDKVLIAVIEQLGDAANLSYSKIKIVDIPDDVEWTVMEHDGSEWVAEVHRTWS